MSPAPAEHGLPRLLRGVGEPGLAELDRHLAVHGSMPDLREYSQDRVVDLVELAGLRGRGGAAFPVASKLRAVSAQRRPKVVVANGSEGEPASKKDRVLLRELPHLVLDGVAVAARAVGAREAIVAVSEADERGATGIRRALGERARAALPEEPRCQLVTVPERFIAGQETALVNGLSGGPVLPTFGPRPFERGVHQRPTLVQNVETLAHLGLIIRHGAAWFRQLGTERDPGSALVSLSGAVGAPGVYEIEHGTPLGELLARAGVEPPLTAVLLGGYFGSWVGADTIPALSLSPAELSRYGASLGAGVIVAMGAGTCPVAETARIADYLSAHSAGQCGPCVNGLGAIADMVQQLASGTADRNARHRLERWTSELPRRGACQYPDGAARFIASALDVFAEQFAEHARRGPCRQCAAAPVLPVGLPVAA